MKRDLLLVRAGPTVGRIVNTPDAPGVFPTDADDVWPYRGKDLLQRVNNELGERKVNSYDIQVIRANYDLEKQHPEFTYRPFARAAPQYSEKFVQWLVQEFKTDPGFFESNRKKYKASR